MQYSFGRNFSSALEAAYTRQAREKLLERQQAFQSSQAQKQRDFRHGEQQDLFTHQDATLENQQAFTAGENDKRRKNYLKAVKIQMNAADEREQKRKAEIEAERKKMANIMTGVDSSAGELSKQLGGINDVNDFFKDRSALTAWFAQKRNEYASNPEALSYLNQKYAELSAPWSYDILPSFLGDKINNSAAWGAIRKEISKNPALLTALTRRYGSSILDWANKPINDLPKASIPGAPSYIGSGATRVNLNGISTYPIEQNDQPQHWDEPVYGDTALDNYFNQKRSQGGMLPW